MEIRLKEQLIAIKWDPFNPPYCYLFLRNIDNKDEEVYKKFLEPEEVFNMVINPERICIGHSINKKEYHLCSTPTDKQYTRCYSCEQKDFERCFLFCDASKPFGNCSQNPQAYEYCKTYPCSIYIALIGNKLKVGVSFNPLKRWINQGADVAVEIFRAKNGFEARKLEKEISSILNIPQTIRKIQKARKINFDLNQSLPKFTEVKEKVISLLESNKVESLESNLLYQDTYLASFYGKISRINVNPIFNDIDKTKHIVGTIVGVKGNLIVTKVDQSYYVSNLSRAIGYTVSFSEEPIRVNRQKSLSDFLSN